MITHEQHIFKIIAIEFVHCVFEMEITMIEHIVAEFVAIVHAATFLENRCMEIIQAIAVMALARPRCRLLDEPFDGTVEHFGNAKRFAA